MGNNKTFKKVDFSEYEGKYNEGIKELMTKTPNKIDVDTMRANLYGYTFTQDYAAREIPDEFSMDYWAELSDEDVLTPQEELLLKTLNSTGDGKTPETALCVIDVFQEYEYMERVEPYSELERKMQGYRDGVDCITFKPNSYGIEKVYFDIKRRFEVGYN